MRAIEEDCILDLYTRFLDDLKEVRENQKKIYASYTKSLERLRRHYISRLVPPTYLAKTIMRSCKMALLNPHLDDIEAEITYLLIRVQLSKSEVRL